MKIRSSFTHPCCCKPVWVFVFCWTQRMIFWRTVVTSCLSINLTIEPHLWLVKISRNLERAHMRDCVPKSKLMRRRTGQKRSELRERERAFQYARARERPTALLGLSRAQNTRPFSRALKRSFSLAQFASLLSSPAPHTNFVSCARRGEQERDLRTMQRASWSGNRRMSKFYLNLSKHVTRQPHTVN